MDDRLANPYWHALVTEQAHVALGGELARRFPPDVIPFAGIAANERAPLRALHALMAPGERLYLASETPLRCEGLEQEEEIPGLQMVFEPGLAVSSGGTGPGVGNGVGVAGGAGVGNHAGTGVAVGVGVGNAVRTGVGHGVAVGVGNDVGTGVAVGVAVGAGNDVGKDAGNPAGNDVGVGVGNAVGNDVAVGVENGVGVGNAVGNGVAVEPLHAADVPAMLRLKEIAFPGFFEPRAASLGSFFGIRVDGSLVALAGERLALPGLREISAVCTHPGHTGKGYAAMLIRHLIRKHEREGLRSFLHLAAGNARALALYRRLGFAVSRELLFRRIRRVG